ncbi:hypothetical protein EDWATA_03174 [Edwardsiella tarda ATCC 23685]|uniref:Uncharacterized protein n=1 Tax=Edwardsiella tarda ATCC 23685 TaxID=500638 RepID=D4F8S4_EDWTA|nr:hypothetical protein EDWATA_03174 [Edwardsiella tarda ATCC 23685]
MLFSLYYISYFVLFIRFKNCHDIFIKSVYSGNGDICPELMSLT